MAKPRPLTSQQEAFCQFYVFGQDGKHLTTVGAYRLAYPKAKMSDANASTEASRLLGNPKIAPRIDELRQAVTQAQIVTVASETAKLEEVYQLALNGHEEVVRDNHGQIVWLLEGVMPKIRRINANLGAAIKARELIAKHNGLLRDKEQVGTGLPTIEERLLKYENNPTWKPEVYGDKIIRLPKRENPEE